MMSDFNKSTLMSLMISFALAIEGGSGADRDPGRLAVRTVRPEKNGPDESSTRFFL